MMGEGWIYWAIFAAAAILFCAPWVVYRLEERSARKDREAWDAWERGRRP